MPRKIRSRCAYKPLRYRKAGLELDYTLLAVENGRATRWPFFARSYATMLRQAKTIAARNNLQSTLTVVDATGREFLRRRAVSASVLHPRFTHRPPWTPARIDARHAEIVPENKLHARIKGP
jgi:hypothetical protein